MSVGLIQAVTPFVEQQYSGLKIEAECNLRSGPGATIQMETT